MLETSASEMRTESGARKERARTYWANPSRERVWTEPQLELENFNARG